MLSTSRSGKMYTKVKEKVTEKLPAAKFNDFEIESISRSQGLIFKAQFQVSNPLPFDIPQWKSAVYTLRSHNSKICAGDIPSKWLKAKKTTIVDVVIKVSFEDLKKWWKEIRHTISGGIINYRLELVLTFNLPVFGEYELPMIAHEDKMKVSDVLNKLLSEILPEKSYRIVRFGLDLYDGQEVSEVVDGLLKEILKEDVYNVVRLAKKLVKGEDFSQVLKELLEVVSPKHPHCQKILTPLLELISN